MGEGGGQQLNNLRSITNIMTRNEWRFIMNYASRNKKLKNMGMTYPQYLNSDIWKQIKARAKKRADRGDSFWIKCNICEKESSNLQLHHTKYKKMDKIVLSNIVPLCGSCHQGLHALQFEKRISIKSAGRRYRRKLEKETI